jgi:predicted nucleotidyltransferase
VSSLQGGCTGILLFGSVARGHVGHRSDIDLAIQGSPRGTFFHLLGKLLLELDHPVDLVNLDSGDPFAPHLKEEGELLQIG